MLEQALAGSSEDILLGAPTGLGFSIQPGRADALVRNEADAPAPETRIGDALHTPAFVSCGALAAGAVAFCAKAAGARARAALPYRPSRTD